MKKNSYITFSLFLLLVSCSQSSDAPSERNYFFDFSETMQGFVADTANPLGNYHDDGPHKVQRFQLDTLPEPYEYRRGVHFKWNSSETMIKGFVKRKIKDLSPRMSFTVDYQVNVLSSVPEFCTNEQGEPGSGTIVSAGIWNEEPVRTIWYIYKEDSQSQSSGRKVYGDDALVTELGNIGLPYVCSNISNYSLDWEHKSLDVSGVTFTSNEEGEAWVYVSVDSTYKGDVDMYITDIEITNIEISGSGVMVN